MSSQPHIKSWEDAVLWLRSRSDRTDVVIGGYYDDPLLGAAQRYADSEEWAAIRKLLPSPAGRALDVGAGRGIASFALARSGFAVTALEPDPSEIVGAGAIRGLAAQSGVPIDVVQDFSEALPFDSGSFDLVFGRAVLHHTRDLQGACAEFFRVLKPGGRLMMIREHVVSRPEDVPAFLDAHPLHHLYGGENAFTLSTYVDALRRARFQLTEVLEPFDSPINLAPSTTASILRELAGRVAGGNRVLSSALSVAFRAPGAWAIIRRLLRLVDNRPGRLYSFVATRP